LEISLKDARFPRASTAILFFRRTKREHNYNDVGSRFTRSQMSGDTEPSDEPGSWWCMPDQVREVVVLG